jgi:hypothetical protein
MKNKDRRPQRIEPSRHDSGWSDAGSRGPAVAVAIVFGLLALSSPAQSQAQTQPQSQQKEEPAGDAAKKPQKDKSKPKKVYTEEDLSGMSGSDVSVVGEDKPAQTKNADKKAGSGASAAGKSGQDEAYWRKRARELLDRIAAADQQIAKVKDDIKKYGNGGFDITTGMKNNIAYINDRNGQVKELEKRKADLEKKLDLLQEEGRKAGAPPEWFR